MNEREFTIFTEEFIKWKRTTSRTISRSRTSRTHRTTRISRKTTRRITKTSKANGTLLVECAVFYAFM